MAAGLSRLQPISGSTANAAKALSPGELANPPKTILMSSVETAMPENVLTIGDVIATVARQ
nr:hypothetical protein [uncultured Methanoregula sp.]